MMTKNNEKWFCTECGDDFGKWSGQCSSCKEWNTIKEFRETKIAGKKSSGGTDLSKITPPKSLSQKGSKRISSEIAEMDRVLGGGFFPGTLILFGGSPGVGKSTLSLQIFTEISDAAYFSGEESVDQILSRAERVFSSSNSKEFKLIKNSIFATNSLEDICETIIKTTPSLAVIDSIQMIGSENSRFGTISQIKESSETLLQIAKSTGTTILLIGHVTKTDEIAGPKILEHVVDVVLRLEGDNTSEVRILRSPKNRFGSTLEVGVFEIREAGLFELQNPSEFFLAERASNACGSAISVVREGSRNFLMEIQALTLRTNFGQPRRTASGINLAKFHLLLAVISKFSPFKCGEYDAYLSIVGGMKISEPAADLAICAAILSSRTEKEIPANTIVIGEVGLSGEVRSVGNIERRLLEAEKLGFKKAIIPQFRGKVGLKSREKLKIKILEVKNIGELVKFLFKK
jgi:DNA repair protein RadA/Sms